MVLVYIVVMPGLVPGIYGLDKDMDGRDLRREAGASRLLPGHDRRE
jgi:hypothetical protein